MHISLETARKVAENFGDPEVACTIYALANEVEASYKREAKLEEDLLGLQLRLSVLLTKFRGPETRGPDIKVAYLDEMAERERVLDDVFKYALHRDRITDGRLEEKDNGTT